MHIDKFKKLIRGEIVYFKPDLLKPYFRKLHFVSNPNHTILAKFQDVNTEKFFILHFTRILSHEEFKIFTQQNSQLGKTLFFKDNRGHIRKGTIVHDSVPIGVHDEQGKYYPVYYEQIITKEQYLEEKLLNG